MSNGTENLLAQAREALEAMQYAKAEVLQRQACELMQRGQVDDSRLASEIERLADIHCIQNKFDECASEYAEVVKLREKFLPQNDHEILRPLYRIAKSHFEEQKYDLAEAEMRRALSLAESRNDSPESLAFTLYELGWLLYFVGKYAEAEPYLLRALPICEETQGATHHQTIRVLEGIALLYANCADLGKDPGPYFNRVIEETKSEEEMRETYVTNLCRLASYVSERKGLEGADELFLQLLSALNDLPKLSDSTKHWIISSGVKHFQSRGKHELVAHLQAEEPDYNVYGDMVKKRLEHAEQTLSSDDPEFAEALLAAGNNATFEGKYQEAELFLTRALDACMKIHGENSSQTLFALNRVCIVKRVLGKLDEAKSAIQRAVYGARMYFSDQGIYPWTLENLALLREAEGETDDAESTYAEAIVEYEKTCGFASYETAEALYHQSGCLVRMGKLGPAEVAIRRAISVMDKIANLSDDEKSDYLSTLSSILEATGRNAEGAEFRKRAERLFEQTKQQNECEA